MAAQVFVSYAHADDPVFDGAAAGWVTVFVDHLQKTIARQSGGRAVRCWMDHRLEPQRNVDDTLRKRITDSQCILAFMSPQYLESKWCQLEMATFVELIGGGKSNDRVFLVELLPTDRDTWHPGIRSITSIEFWADSFDQPEPMTLGWPVPDPRGNKGYWRELNNLAAVLARQIRKILEPSHSDPTDKKATVPVPAVSTSKTVWVADPTDDLLERWGSLSERLRDKGYGVRPEAVGQYPLHDERLYREALNRDLRQADLFVQMLGPLPGKKPVWADSRLTLVQADAARIESTGRELPLISWRLPEVDLVDITDSDYKKLLAGATDIEFDDLCRQILDLLMEPVGNSAPVSQLSVVINADKSDRDLGKYARDLLFELEVDATLVAEPLPSQPASHYRRDIEALLENNHGVLIVYGKAPPSWVQSTHSHARKFLGSRRSGLWEGLLDGPPEEKPEHGLRSPNLMVLSCHSGVSVDPLKRFVDSLRQGIGHV